MTLALFGLCPMFVVGLCGNARGWCGKKVCGDVALLLTCRYFWGEQDHMMVHAQPENI